MSSNDYLTLIQHFKHIKLFELFYKEEMLSDFCVYIAWRKHLGGWENTR